MVNKKSPAIRNESDLWRLRKRLSNPDSNQDKQNQNLLCCHYTIGQSASTEVSNHLSKIWQS